MFFARSGLVAATLVVLQSTLSVAAPVSDNAVHELEKRITCHTTEVPINNACVWCASLYKNASTCTRSVPVTCSYGEVNSARKCAAVDCTKTPGSYLSSDGTPYTLYGGYRLPLPLPAKQQPFRPFAPVGGRPPQCVVPHFNSRVVVFTPGRTVNEDGSCSGQNGPLNQNLVQTVSPGAVVFLKGYCSDYAKNRFVTANQAENVCEQFFAAADGTITPK